MGYLKAVFIIAITMALSLTITMKTISTKEEAIKLPATASSLDDAHFQQQQALFMQHEKNKLLPSKRVSRFLAQKQNPNAPIHCHRDSEICELFGAENATCCNNKCMDLGYDRHNCGACKKKCKFPETCCRGQCVDTSFDKRHCGRCNNRCETGQYCVFGMCDYA